MTTAPGTVPGPSSVSYPRAWPALAVALVGFVAAFALSLAWPNLRSAWSAAPPWLASGVDLIVLSLPLVAATIVAVRVGRSPDVRAALGLRGARGTDVVLGLALGLVLRALVELVAPTTATLGGPFLTDLDASRVAALTVLVLGVVAISPVVEETFFRGVVLRALESGCLGPLGRVTAGAVAVLVSTGAFVALHLATAGSSVPTGLLLGTLGVGLGCGILTVVTGRLFASLIAHVVFNALGVVVLLL